MSKKMSGNLQVRETILLLSTILEENGTSTIHAEHFRLAKFDKNDAVSVLWKLLFELLYLCQFGNIDQASLKAISHFSAEELCIYVKNGMQERGYLSTAFANLPNDASSGSRELLLAFGWLFSTENIIDKFVNKYISPVSQDTTLFLQEQLSVFQNTAIKSVKRSAKDFSSSVQNLLVLNGKLRLGLHRLHAYQQEEVHLTFKMHDVTSRNVLPKESSHLTFNEIYLLRHPDKLKKMMNALKKDNERLEHILLWKEYEHVFWTWMLSVYHLKEKETSNTWDEKCDVYLSLPVTIKQDIQHCLRQLTSTILSYESTIESLEDLWNLKKDEVSPLELDKLLSQVNEEIILQKNNLMKIEPKRSSSEKPKPNFILQKQCKTTSKQPKFSNHTNIQSYTNAFKAQISKMESELLKVKEECSKELDALAQKIPSVICLQSSPVQKTTS